MSLTLVDFVKQQEPLFIKAATDERMVTGRSIEEVGDKRLQTNIERNGWDVNDPEREDA